MAIALLFWHFGWDSNPLEVKRQFLIGPCALSRDVTRLDNGLLSWYQAVWRWWLSLIDNLPEVVNFLYTLSTYFLYFCNGSQAYLILNALLSVCLFPPATITLLNKWRDVTSLTVYSPLHLWLPTTVKLIWRPSVLQGDKMYSNRWLQKREIWLVMW